MALAFAERYCLEAALKRFDSVTNPKLKDTLAKIIRLHCLLFVKDNLGYYLANGIISQKAALGFDADYQQAVKDLVPSVNNIIEGFNLPKIAQLSPPIIRDLNKFNEQSDPDNYEAAGDFFDWKQGPKL